MTGKDMMGRHEKALSAVVGKSYLSPLRYPGGKRKLVTEIGRRLDRAGVTHIDRLLEPFVGGGAMFLSFLEADVAGEVVINDFDPLVADFWRTVFSSDCDKLADMILDHPATLDTWNELKSTEYDTPLARAFQCLYLNRTSFSGSLHKGAGPIGGATQKGAYKIGCRYNQEKLAERLWYLKRFADRVTVRNMDFRRFVGVYKCGHAQRRTPLSVMWYLDPPFFHKADKLYRFSFQDPDHKRLMDFLSDLDGHWLLSYDYCAESRRFYQDHPGRDVVDMRYTAAGAQAVQQLAASEMIVTNIGKSFDVEAGRAISTAPAKSGAGAL